MRDFRLDMQVYDYKNEKHEIYGKFSKLKREQLCFIQDLSICYDIYEDKYTFRWSDLGQEIYSEIAMENATSSDIEEVVKGYLEHYDIRYDYVKVEVL